MFRIKKYAKGYVVEVQKKRWYGKKYWTHYISVRGISHVPWYYQSYEAAETALLKSVKWTTISNSNRFLQIKDPVPQSEIPVPAPPIH